MKNRKALQGDYGRAPGLPMTLDEEWLATCREDALEPERRIIDAYHHMFWSGRSPNGPSTSSLMSAPAIMSWLRSSLNRRNACPPGSPRPSGSTGLIREWSSADPHPAL